MAQRGEIKPDTSGTGRLTLPPKFVAMLGVVALDPTDEGALPVGRGAIGAGVDPAFEIGVERVEIPARAFLAQVVDRLVGHVAARRGGREPGQGRADQRARIDRGAFRWRCSFALFCSGSFEGILGSTGCGGTKFPRGNIFPPRQPTPL